MVGPARSWCFPALRLHSFGHSRDWIAGQNMLSPPQGLPPLSSSLTSGPGRFQSSLGPVTAEGAEGPPLDC